MSTISFCSSRYFLILSLSFNLFNSFVIIGDLLFNRSDFFSLIKSLSTFSLTKSSFSIPAFLIFKHFTTPKFCLVFWISSIVSDTPFSFNVNNVLDNVDDSSKPAITWSFFTKLVVFIIKPSNLILFISVSFFNLSKTLEIFCFAINLILAGSSLSLIIFFTNDRGLVFSSDFSIICNIEILFPV